MSDTVTTFYDNLADVYRYIFPDWNASVRRQGKTIDGILEAYGFLPANHALYDCTCGIGTQVFGLAEQGWRVHGSDISPQAIAKAEEYSREYDMIFSPTFAAADLLNPSENPTQYDVVLSLDNAIPHFMINADLLTALRTMKAHLKDNGLLMISIRNYDALIENPPKSTQASVNDSDDGRRIIFQTWDWADDLSSYQLNMYITQHVGDTITTQCFPAEYRALRREQLSDALSQVGFHDIGWLMPDDSAYYQPIVTARLR
jgi:glycine/sarcosine N-methyltransferase